MKRLALLGLFACTQLFSLGAHAENSANPFVKGDAATGAAKAAACVACHGPDGNSSNPDWPKLAGQNATYLVNQLTAFKSGARKNPIMAGQVATLVDQDMRDLAVHFAAQKQSPGVASPDSVKTAEKLYRAGDATRGLPGCAGCHGPKGTGNPGAGYARIGGQQSAYTATQLKSFRAGERKAGDNGQMMAAVAVKLSDAEIEALASYVGGLQ
jgi:cytochrome c553